MNANKSVTIFTVVAALGFGLVPRAAACTNTTDLSALAAQAVSPDPAQAQRATGRLRDAGPAGLQALVNAHRQQIEIHSERGRSLLPETTPSDNGAWERLRAALDAVGRQRD